MDVPATPTPPPTTPHNRTNLNYHDIPPRKISTPGGILDAHNHTREPQYTQLFVDVAAAYGVTEFYTMCPLEHAPALKEKFPGIFHFIAVPSWSFIKDGITDAFFTDWAKRLDTFYELGARLVKFHAAPGTTRRMGVTLDDPRILHLAKHAYDLGYHFMTHIGDPMAWFYGKGTYADGSGGGYGTFDSQFAQLERMLERYPDRIHLGAHMGGSLEKLPALAKRLDTFPHYVLDTGATKWIVRAVSEQSPAAVRDFIIHYQNRIVFGSDLVVGDKYDWDHYASRFWTHQKLWESTFTGESPITDPDAGKGFSPSTGTFDESQADNIPKLLGLNLPPDVLQKLYRTNAEKILPR